MIRTYRYSIYTYKVLFYWYFDTHREPTEVSTYFILEKVLIFQVIFIQSILAPLGKQWRYFYLVYFSESLSVYLIYITKSPAI